MTARARRSRGPGRPGLWAVQVSGTRAPARPEGGFSDPRVAAAPPAPRLRGGPRGAVRSALGVSAAPSPLRPHAMPSHCSPRTSGAQRSPRSRTAAARCTRPGSRWKSGRTAGEEEKGRRRGPSTAVSPASAPGPMAVPGTRRPLQAPRSRASRASGSGAVWLGTRTPVHVSHVTPLLRPPGQRPGLCPPRCPPPAPRPEARGHAPLPGTV